LQQTYKPILQAKFEKIAKEMDSLPGDVMRLIAAQLDGVSLAQLGATCWHWLRLGMFFSCPFFAFAFLR
jgi:hypothetical protein